MYKIQDPKTVVSPRDCIQDVKVIYNGADDPGYSIAIVTWQGIRKIAIRWNISQREWDNTNKQNGSQICLGEPNSRGYATWFILPEEFLSSILKQNDDVYTKVKDAMDNDVI